MLKSGGALRAQMILKWSSICAILGSVMGLLYENKEDN